MLNQAVNACVASHNVVLIVVVDTERLHGVDQRLDGGDDVLEHQAGEASPVGLAVAGAVDDPHLFDKGALPAFPSAWGGGRKEKVTSVFFVLFAPAPPISAV